MFKGKPMPCWKSFILLNHVNKNILLVMLHFVNELLLNENKVLNLVSASQEQLIGNNQGRHGL
jgi:hypothetical protein